VLPFVEAMNPLGGRAAAYVCREFTCRAPAADIGQLDEALGAAAHTPSAG